MTTRLKDFGFSLSGWLMFADVCAVELLEWEFDDIFHLFRDLGHSYR